MKSIKTDYHMHSISPDARIPMKEMCEGAYQKGMKEIVMTDHYEFYENKMNGPHFNDEYLQEYFKQLKSCKEEYEGKLIIKAGMEFGQIYLAKEEYQKMIQKYKYDYIIGSVHKVHDIDISRMEYTSGNLEKIADAYYNSVLELVETGDFDCLGHLDLFKRHAVKHGFSDKIEQFEPIIKEILSVLINRGKGIELNTSSIRQGVGEPLPGEVVLKWYKELGGRIVTVGSDAHKPEDIGADFDEAKKILEQVGIQGVAIFTKRKCINDLDL
ncbi:MAG: histidinol-phosphatase [Lachnotalea sp.]